MITTNELKKGRRVLLRNGWQADIMDNMKGNTRLAKVYGFETEIGSVYSHDIAQAETLGINSLTQWIRVEHTPAQQKLRAKVKAYGF
jgi:hypothetical protein